LAYRGRDDEDDGAQEDYSRVRQPDQRNREIFAIADSLLGASRIKVVCADGQSRMGRIPGKLKKRMWIRPGDLLIVKPWDFQDDKADVLFRYTRTQAVNLAKRKLIPESINIF
jgi:translation initiation factor 1A